MRISRKTSIASCRWSYTVRFLLVLLIQVITPATLVTFRGSSIESSSSDDVLSKGFNSAFWCLEMSFSIAHLSIWHDLTPPQEFLLMRSNLVEVLGVGRSLHGGGNWGVGRWGNIDGWSGIERGCSDWREYLGIGSVVLSEGKKWGFLR